jgi:3-hydroxyisobutyrate dehydrogenase-like beta-hydroxyacid dehydrogenase
MWIVNEKKIGFIGLGIMGPDGVTPVARGL